MRGGAIFVTSDRPIGLRQISPTAITRYDETSHATFTRPASPPTRPAPTMIPNEAAVKIMPISIFIGVDGSARARRSSPHTHTSAGENRMTPNGSTDWNRSGGHDVIVLSRAQNVSVK